MKLLTCPVNGTRPLAEFVFGGEYRAMPDPATCSDAEWAAYVHYRNGAPGVKKEWWYHSPSGTWFIAERNTGTDEILKTYLPNDTSQGVSHE
jgi:sarcosine oxidase, subunit delta